MLFLSVTFNYDLCMTLTYKLDLGMVKVNHHAKYLRESNASVIRSKVMFETHTHTHICEAGVKQRVSAAGTMNMTER